MATRKNTTKREAAAEPRGQTVSDLRWDSLFSSLGRIEIVLLVGGVLLLMVLIYTIQSILSPFLALGAILFLLFPLRRYVLARNLMWLAIVLFALWFLNTLSHILTPFILALVFAYILDPVVDLFESWGVPRWISSLVLILLFVVGIALVLFFVLPIALNQFEGVLETFSKLVNDFRSTLLNSNIVRLLERYGISAEELRNAVSNRLTPRLDDILKGLLDVILGFVSGVSGLVTQIFYILLVPFLTFYMLTDFPKIAHRFRMLFPKRVRGQVAVYMHQADVLVGHYLRGAMTVAILQGIAVAVIFSIAGIKYALLLGLLAGLLDLVPYFGLMTIMVLSAIIAAFSDPPVLTKVGIALASILILHVVEVVFLSPKIVGNQIGMHPVIIILSLLVFMFLMGFVGILIAVPTTALIILFIREWEAKRRGPAPVESETSIPL